MTVEGVASVEKIRARLATGLTFWTHSFMSALQNSMSPPYSGCQSSLR